MRRVPKRNLAIVSIGALSVLCGSSGDTKANDFEKFDFSLRFPAAISRFATYADVAGVGGASAASEWQSSINPAAVGWQPEERGRIFSVSPQFSTVGFSEGTRLNVPAVSLAVDGGPAGRFLGTFARVSSNNAASKSGLKFDFDMDLAQIGWGWRFSDEWATGINLSYAKSSTDFAAGARDASHTQDHTYGARLGVLHQMTERLRVGIVADYGIAPSDTTSFDFMGLGLGDVHVHDVTRQLLLRPGVAYQYARNSNIYLDYQFGRFSNGTGILIVDRFFTGVEQRIFEWLYVRGGSAVDTRGNFAATAGIGLYPVKWASVDVGFQENFFPELEPDFGRSRLFGVSGSISF